MHSSRMDGSTGLEALIAQQQLAIKVLSKVQDQVRSQGEAVVELLEAAAEMVEHPGPSSDGEHGLDIHA